MEPFTRPCLLALLPPFVVRPCGRDPPTRLHGLSLLLDRGKLRSARLGPWGVRIIKTHPHDRGPV
jgi:hypothetical protein